jgi:uncharacterized protein YbaR (Trm112 family)
MALLQFISRPATLLGLSVVPACTSLRASFSSSSSSTTTSPCTPAAASFDAGVLDFVACPVTWSALHQCPDGLQSNVIQINTQVRVQVTYPIVDGMACLMPLHGKLEQFHGESATASSDQQ